MTALADMADVVVTGPELSKLDYSRSYKIYLYTPNKSPMTVPPACLLRRSLPVSYP